MGQRHDTTLAIELIASPMASGGVGAVFSKLGVRDHAAVIVFAYDHGIVEPHPGSHRP